MGWSWSLSWSLALVLVLVPGPGPGPWSWSWSLVALVPGPWPWSWSWSLVLVLVPGPGPGPRPLVFRDPDMISGMSEPDPDAGQTGLGCQNLAFQRFEPIIIFDFSWRFRKKALEKHISKQMRVYKQITFFNKNQIFQ